MNITTFAENVKHLRENDGLKQTEMAESIGFSFQKWNNYERAASRPMLEDLVKISRYFGILESDLLHTEIPESNLIKLYNNYILSQREAENSENTPPSKSFLTYLNSNKAPVPTPENGGTASRFASPAASPPPKKSEKSYGYNNRNQPPQAPFLHEPEAAYGHNPKSTENERIARLQGLLSKIKDLLDTYFE